MDIGIIGTGNVGRALGTGWVAAGHSVVYGSRSPNDADLRAELEGANATVATPEAAVGAGDVVVLAVPGSAGPEVAADNADALAGAPLVDATNTVERTDDALAERVAAAAPGAHVVKAFNTIGAGRMADPTFDGERATMFLAGDDADAKTVVADLAADLGFAPLDAGGLDAAVMLEDLARLWIHLSKSHGRDIGFRLLGADQ